MSRQSAAYGERLVHPDEFLYPRIYEQVVAYAYLAGALKAAVMEHEVKVCRVKHYVTVVG